MVISLARRGEPSEGSAFAEPCYRIPALAITAEGRIVIAYDVRADHLDLPGEFDIMIRTSDDGGISWSEPVALRRHENERGFGDASLICDPLTGRLWCWYVASTGQNFWDDEPLELWLACSEDAGTSWRHRRIFHAELFHKRKRSVPVPNDIGGSPHNDRELVCSAGMDQRKADEDFLLGSMFASSGNGVALSSGRLIQPMVLRQAGTRRRHAAMAVSDDHGRTWQLGDIIADCDESKVVELADGRILLHARSTPRRLQAVSCDGGLSFSTPQPHPQLPDPSCNGGLTRTADGSLLCTLLDFPADSIAEDLDPTRGRGAELAWRSRANLVSFSSADDGYSWQPRSVIDPGPAGYSVVAPYGRDVLVAWEHGIYAAITMSRISS